MQLPHVFYTFIHIPTNVIMCLFFVNLLFHMIYYTVNTHTPSSYIRIRLSLIKPGILFLDANFARINFAKVP
jgi:hypothetical protein